MNEKKTPKAAETGYLHGFTQQEQDRLYRQARFVEHKVHEGLPFQRCRNLLEVACGVGAQTDILLRRNPELHITGVDRSELNLKRAGEHLAQVPWASGRYQLVCDDANRLKFEAATYDSAFLCWILEHVSDPMLLLSEVRRVLQPGAPIVVSEVLNSTFFIAPYSPNTLAYWMAFNDYQYELGGDPYVGAKLGNLLLAVGYRDITTAVKTFHWDNREPGERAEFLGHWTELLMSGADGLLQAGKVSAEVVRGMGEELQEAAHNPNSVFFYSFIQAQGRVW